jgi:hypothetical protein
LQGKPIQLIHALKDFKATPPGQILFDYLKTFCYGDQHTYVVGDSHASAFNEGMRFVYLELERLVNSDERKLANPYTTLEDDSQ